MPISDTANLQDGREIKQVTLSGGGLTAKIVTLGAAIQDLRLEGHGPSLVLGFADIAHYAQNTPCMGAIAGSVANRIGNGRFTIDDKIFELDKNWLGKHTLHGGIQGTQYQNWSIIDARENTVTLEHTQPDGFMGFPGNLTMHCTYTLLPDATLDLKLTATTDQATFVNLASHCYFNLDGRAQIDQHRLEIMAETVLEYDDDAIPTGQTISVAGTQYDYRTPRGVMSDILDSNFCLAPQDGLQCAARVTTQSNRSLEIWTDQPGLQAYNAPGFGLDHPGVDGANYGNFAGLALEPQNWPDAPNHAHFPSAALRPGETYKSHSQFKFR